MAHLNLNIFFFSFGAGAETFSKLLDFSKGIQLQIHIWVVLFYLNLGSTLALFPSMSHLSPLWWWWVHAGFSSGPISVSTQLIVWGLTPAPEPYLVCTFDLHLGSAPAPVPSMSHLSSLCWGVNSRSPSRSIFGLYFLP